MYRILHLALTLSVFVSPVRALAVLPVAEPVQAEAVQTTERAQANTVPYTIALDTTSPAGVMVQDLPKPNFDTEVLEPLRVKQAAQATAKRKKSKRTVAPHVARVSAAATDENLLKLRLCEAGGIYNRNTGNGYFGAYQYAIGSWGGYGGYARADLAPAEVQDAKVRGHVAVHGWGAWPACSRKLGLR